MEHLNHLQPKHITNSLCKIRQNLRTAHHSNERIFVRVPIVMLVTTNALEEIFDLHKDISPLRNWFRPYSKQLDNHGPNRCQRNRYLTRSPAQLIGQLLLLE